MDKELKKLNKEIDQLKKRKEKALKYSTSYAEREQLLKEIKQLEMVKQSPSAMKAFANTFGKGLKTVGKGLWSAVASGSKNLSKNSPEFRAMAKKPDKYNQPFSSLAMMYAPSQSEPKTLPKKISKKLKKQMKKMDMTRQSNPSPWELP